MRLVLRLLLVALLPLTAAADDLLMTVGLEDPDALPAEVRVRFVVNEKGGTERIEVLRSPDEALSAATVEAVSGWTFKPARKEGRVVKTSMTATIAFKPVAPSPSPGATPTSGSL